MDSWGSGLQPQPQGWTAENEVAALVKVPSAAAAPCWGVMVIVLIRDMATVWRDAWAWVRDSRVFMCHLPCCVSPLPFLGTVPPAEGD